MGSRVVLVLLAVLVPVERLVPVVSEAFQVSKVRLAMLATRDLLDEPAILDQRVNKVKLVRKVYEVVTVNRELRVQK